jgi:hypothetical protein
MLASLLLVAIVIVVKPDGSQAGHEGSAGAGDFVQVPILLRSLVIPIAETVLRIR